MKRYVEANDALPVPEELRRRAAEGGKTPRRARRVWLVPAAAVVAAALLVGTLLPRHGIAGLSAYAVAEPEAVVCAPYPTEDGENFDPWFREQQVRWGLGEAAREDLYPFLAATAPVLLGETGGENRVYSPVNLYLALGMLAETAGGDSRAQVLALLGAEDLEDLRSSAAGVLGACWRDDGAVTARPAASLWLSDTLTYRREVLDALAETYRASSFSGPMGDEAYTRALRSWLDRQTGGLLSDAAEGAELTDQTVLALAATLYYSARWQQEFAPENTAPGTFHGRAGDQTADFLRQEREETYYWGDRFSAVARSLAESGELWLILPDEGVTPEELLEDSQVPDMVRTARYGGYGNQKRLIVDLSLPKFDVQSDLDLRAGLEALGVTDVFDAARADFSPLFGEEEGAVLSQVQHAARVTVDEEGCTAAAFTMLQYAGAAPPPDEHVTFTLDRPFLFLLTDDAGLPLFVGIVNRL